MVKNTFVAEVTFEWFCNEFQPLQSAFTNINQYSFIVVGKYQNFKSRFALGIKIWLYANRYPE